MKHLYRTNIMLDKTVDGDNIHTRSYLVLAGSAFEAMCRMMERVQDKVTSQRLETVTLSFNIIQIDDHEVIL